MWQIKINDTLQWRYNERDGVSNHQPQDCLLYRLFRRRSNKTSNFRVTGLCEGNSPVTGEFLAQRASNAEIVSIWWRHHEKHLQHAEIHGNDLFNSLSPRDAIMRQLANHHWFSVMIMACGLVGPKPLSETMREYCLLDPWEQTTVKS